MENFAQFRTLSGNTEDSPTDKPVVLHGPGDKELRSVNLEGLDPLRGTVLMFQVSGTHDGSILKIVRNPGEHEHELVTVKLDATFKQPRSCHEIVPGNLLSEDGNHLVMRVSDTPAGGIVTVSDVVLLYHATTTP